jgi:hypothetical protein
MDVEVKPSRWSVKKADHLREVAELTAARDEAQAMAYVLRMEGERLWQSEQAWRRFAAWYSAAAFVAGVLLAWGLL